MSLFVSVRMYTFTGNPDECRPPVQQDASAYKQILRFITVQYLSV